MSPNEKRANPSTPDHASPDEPRRPPNNVGNPTPPTGTRMRPAPSLHPPQPPIPAARGARPDHPRGSQQGQVQCATADVAPDHVTGPHKSPATNSNRYINVRSAHSATTNDRAPEPVNNRRYAGDLHKDLVGLTACPCARASTGTPTTSSPRTWPEPDCGTAPPAVPPAGGARALLNCEVS